MNRYLKGCLIFTGILILVIAVLAGLLMWSMGRKQEQAKEDGARFSAICDTIPYVTEQPEIRFAGFRTNEIGTLTFQLLRNGHVIRDTIIKDAFKPASGGSTCYSIQLPFAYFLKTDTILVTTKSRLCYYISGYHHYAYLHYGMFGYVGGHDCRFSESCIINNAGSDGVLIQDEGWVNPARSALIRKISPNTPAFDSISAKAPVSYQEAQRIFDKNRKNKHLYSMITCRIEEGPDGSFYLFKEERESNRPHSDMIRINTQTGAYRRLPNYPYEE